jgi:ATP-dependent Zn protease
MTGNQRVSRKSVLTAYHESGHTVVAYLLRRNFA